MNFLVIIYVYPKYFAKFYQYFMFCIVSMTLPSYSFVKVTLSRNLLSEIFKVTLKSSSCRLQTLLWLGLFFYIFYRSGIVQTSLWRKYKILKDTGCLDIFDLNICFRLLDHCCCCCCEIFSIKTVSLRH